MGRQEGRIDLNKHQVSFEDAASVFADPLAAMLEDALDRPQRETRYAP
ncbi:MAG: BrnT family toxin [Deltaproteobacteria bacterium]